MDSSVQRWLTGYDSLSTIKEMILEACGGVRKMNPIRDYWEFSIL